MDLVATTTKATSKGAKLEVFQNLFDINAGFDRVMSGRSESAAGVRPPPTEAIAGFVRRDSIRHEFLPRQRDRGRRDRRGGPAISQALPFREADQLRTCFSARQEG